MQKFLSSVFVFVIVLSLGYAQGVLNAQAFSEVKNEMSIVASVNVFNAKIISQNENKFQISFDIFNEQGIQPDIRYAVMLAKKTSQGSIVVDNNTYEEVLSIGAGQTIKKEIEYNAPTFLKGDFTASVFVFTSDSLPLGIGLLGPVQLRGVDQYIEIVNESCYLTVDGEIPEKKYSLDQGVDVGKEEKLIGKCQIKNNFQSQITTIAKFENHYRTSSGKLVENENASEQKFILNPSETKDVSIVIPKALQPQAYDAILEFMDLNKTIISNKAAFHYVLRGESATIQNIKLDKDYYTSGDVAKISFNWVGSADLHMQTRKNSGNRTENPSIRLMLNSSDGSTCAQAIDVVAPKTEMERLRLVEYDMNIIKDCSNPRIVVQVLSDDGRVLAEKRVEIKSENIPIDKTVKPETLNYESSERGDSKMIYWILFITGVVLLAVLIWIGIGFVRKNKKLLGLLFAIGLSLFVASEKASALTFTNVYCDSPSHCLTTHIVAGINKSVYNPGEQLIMNASILDAYCSNGSNFLANVSSRNVPLEEKYILMIQSGGWGASSSRYSNAPNVGGNYAVRFKAKTTWWHDLTDLNSDTNYGTIPYTVIGNGSCGPANGVAVYSEPTTGLCSVTASPATVTGNGPWNWTCNGSGGGTNVSCNAPLAPPIEGVCGSANGKSFPTAPTTNLCFKGSASPIPSGSGPWNWTCKGLGGGTDSPLCKAYTCSPVNDYGTCDCATETKRHEFGTTCSSTSEYIACSASEKNSCRDFNWREVAP